MDPLLAIIPVAAGAYVATNLDNFTLLIMLLARYEQRSRSVSAAYLLCMLILGAAGFWVGAAAGAAAALYIGWLGLVPISIGVIGLWRLYRSPGSASHENEYKKGLDSGVAVFVTVLFSQLGNGADTIVTFASLFADSTAAADVLIIFSFVAMAVVFVLAANYGVRHPAVGDWAERFAPRLTPWLLIIVGAYIVANTGTDVAPG